MLNEKRPFAVVTVLSAQGSTPLPAGAHALIEADGAIHGTVGGGAVEAEAIRQAMAALTTQERRVFDFDLHGPGPHDPSPICGGRMRLLVDPRPAEFAEALSKLLNALAERKRGWWIFGLGEKMPWNLRCYFTEAGQPFPRGGLQEALCISAGLSTEAAVYLPPIPGQRGEILMEPVVPVPRLVMVGGGHVGQAVAAQAALLGFEIIVVEDRPEFARPALFPPGTHTLCGDIEKTLASLSWDRDTSVVLATRGHQKDAEALRICIQRCTGYLGMIGSRRKVPLMRQMFLERGWATAEQWEKVYAPIGLDIGAVTVQEIATAILAQIIAVRRKGNAPRIPLASDS
ncbi:XdhC family protein [Fontisphaera persica]|uniref:XdhC family protein n=1 Tax=Fontisphaera persica TaxID=2974023 RepID=UPI0024BF9C5C|nr:XdhC/CoxI family protein [Fontisphaera persica]WCJ60406.1 XdhC family protein [Fontisphaera persica]